jgi:uncharacterized membrane protein YbaN (DUF454 family)
MTKIVAGTKKTLMIVASVLLISLGILGMILPLIPGIPFLILGLTLVGFDSKEFIKKILDIITKKVKPENTVL